MVWGGEAFPPLIMESVILNTFYEFWSGILEVGNSRVESWRWEILDWNPGGREFWIRILEWGGYSGGGICDASCC